MANIVLDNNKDFKVLMFLLLLDLVNDRDYLSEDEKSDFELLRKHLIKKGIKPSLFEFYLSSDGLLKQKYKLFKKNLEKDKEIILTIKGL